MATQPLASRRLRFDDFELDVRAGQLRKQGRLLRLRGQPLQVLEILLERAGDVMTREELQSQIWPADTFVDYDHSLHNAIARIREVLGDSAENPRYIETLPRRGYRYIGPVEDVQTPLASVENGEKPRKVVSLVAPQKRKGRLALVVRASIVCASLIFGLIVWTRWRSSYAEATASPIHSIAVLPFSNLSGDPSQEYFADGTTDQLITDLAQIGSLRVISRTSVMQYKVTTKSLPEIARELNVDAIVEGSVIRSGERVRVTAQLIRASADQHIWADTYDRDRGDILKLQSELADAIAQRVRAEITPTQRAQMRKARVVDPVAYDSYVQGRLYFTTEYMKPDSLKKAQHLFQESIQKDPDFALPYAGLADTYVYLAFDGALPRDEASRSARKNVTRALELDDTIGEAYDTLGVLSSSFDWDWEAADRAFNRALELAPSYSCAHEDRAIFLAFLGRRAEALAEIAKIDQLDTSFSSVQSESEAYFDLRDYDGLIEASKRGLILSPKDSSLHYNLGAGYEGTGRLEAAISEYQKAMGTSQDPRPGIALAHAWAAVGQKGKAEKMLRYLERNPKAMASPYTMATIYAGLGENDRALDSLKKACLEKSLDAGRIRSDFLLDSLRLDPRFQDLLRHIGLA